MDGNEYFMIPTPGSEKQLKNCQIFCFLVVDYYHQSSQQTVIVQHFDNRLHNHQVYPSKISFPFYVFLVVSLHDKSC
ncbi:hypothetical protein X975_02831, partial [Stegodyphus mimosarum]